jgi:uncharacterized protein (TIGR02271 family)
MTRGTSAGTGMSQHTRMLTAMYDSRTDAEEAIERLIAIGIPRTNCRLVEGASTSQSSSTPAASRSPSDQGGRVRDPYESKGFWDSLADLFMPDEDRYTYAEGLRRGGYLLSVNVTDAQYEKALDILDDEGTIDIDERTEMWRKEGWSDKNYESYSHGTSAGRGTATAGQTDYERTTGRKTSAQTGTKGREEAIPIVEEQLRVGKREVGGGRVRVRSYVVEQPVQEQVTLRDEKVSVERRPVDRPLTGTEDAFRERTIEADERREEAVVNKQARVKEEVVVRKDAQQRTETVSDKVRRTEVEVDDETRSKTDSRKGKR